MILSSFRNHSKVIIESQNKLMRIRETSKVKRSESDVQKQITAAAKFKKQARGPRNPALNFKSVCLETISRIMADNPWIKS